jgi:hypothetical protein
VILNDGRIRESGPWGPKKLQHRGLNSLSAALGARLAVTKNLLKKINHSQKLLKIIPFQVLVPQFQLKELRG